MNIVVTGATGHIGNVLVRELLAQGHSVRALVPPFENDLPIRGLDVEIVAADVCDAASLSTAFEGADAVYHLAGIIAITPGREALLQKVNVQGTRNVVDACLESGVGRLVYTSSIHAIQEPPQGIVINETFPVDPDNVLGPYARSKAMATLEVKKGMAHGLNAVIVHPTGVIGPFDFRISEMGQLMLDFIRGKLKAYLDGAYDFADVRDVAHGMTLACSKGRRGESYILSGERVSIKRIMELLEEISGVKAPKFKVPAWLAHSVGKLAPIYYRIARSKPLFTDYSVDVLRSNSVVTSEKARMELGYKPRSAHESIFDSVAWFRQYLTPAQLALAVRRV
ncbi:MAG: SDR family oxidoreductase [Dehalococcoidia bacterium]|jgi:dihydroflavonol-4-reductase